MPTFIQSDAITYILFFCQLQKWENNVIVMQVVALPINVSYRLLLSPYIPTEMSFKSSLSKHKSLLLTWILRSVSGYAASDDFGSVNCV